MEIFANLLRWSTILTLLTIATACSSSPKATAPQSTTSPSTVVSSEPIIAPTTTPSANGAQTPTTPQASPTAPGQISVNIGELETFKHPSGLFSINIPKGWQKQENSKPGELLALWTNPGGNGLLLINIAKVPAQVPPEQLGLKLKELLQKQFGQKTNLTLSNPQASSNGSSQVSWSYQETANGKTVTVAGKSFIQQHNDKISIIYVGYPKDQESQVQAKFNAIVNSYKVDPAANFP